jgi:hypothetical protein
MVNLAAQMRGNKKEWKKYIQEKKMINEIN